MRNTDGINLPWVPDVLEIEAMLAVFNSIGAQPSTRPNVGYSFPAHLLDAKAEAALAAGAQASHRNNFDFNLQYSTPEFIEGSSKRTSVKEMHEVWE
jgi:hypothetical protein